MKRPVFWAVVMFALGEVTGLFVRTWRQLGIAVAMLFCVGLISMWLCFKTFLKQKQGWFRIVFLMLPLGCGYSAFRSGNYQYFKYGRDCNAKFACAIAEVIPEKHSVLEATIWGTVKAINQSANSSSAIVRLSKYEGNDWQEKSFYVGAYVLVNDASEVRIGDEIMLHGELSLIQAAENPGQFDMQTYYLARKIRYKIKYDTLEILRRRDNIKKCIMDARAYLKTCIYQNANEDAAALYSAILLGDRTAISKAVKGLFECAGISHILSISALHISLVAMTFYKLLRRLGVHFTVACPCAFILVFLYGTLSGWSFSAVRAAIMLGLVFFGELLGRKVDLLTSASIALLMMSATSPYMLLDGGVCIGFAAVEGIALGQAYNRAWLKAIKKRQQRSYDASEIKKLKQKLLQKISTAFVVSACIYIVTAPVLARLYYSVSTYTIFVNLMVVPLMTVVISCGLIGALLSCVHLPLGGLFFSFGGSILNLFKWICRIVIRLPMSSIRTGKITMLEIFLYYFLLAIAILFSTKWFRIKSCKIYHKLTYKWLDKRGWKKVLLGIYTLYLISCVSALTMLRRSLLQEKMVFLAVGQGDGILLRTSSRCNIVIDGGSTSNELVGENILLPAIKSEAMHHVNYWFVSHADKDHISGLEAILDMGALSQVDIDCIVIAKAAVGDINTERLLEKADRNNIDIAYMEQGDKLAGAGDFELLCVGPSKGMERNDNRNAVSLCLVYESDCYCVLFTGDAEAEEMQAVVSYLKTVRWPKQDQRLNVLKVPHHGSRYSCLSGQAVDFYDSFDVAIISCGRNNLYGHPHEETMEVLEQNDCSILRTDTLGAIVIQK